MKMASKKDSTSTEMKSEFADDESSTSPPLENSFPAVLPAIEESDDSNFETESYALLHNEDYQKLMNTLVKLHASKIQAVKNLERLHEAREAALKDPIAFVKALQSGEDLNLPGRIKPIEIPEIDWSKYNINQIIQEFRPKTRRLAKGNSVPEAGEQTVPEPEVGETKPAVKTERPRSDTFNVPWTLEEQRKLEELLIKYPDEPMSSKRWAKISKELGTRNLMQVQSRVQKYFIALKKEGLPVPGKDPKTFTTRSKRRGMWQSQPSSLSSKYMRAFDFDHSYSTNAGGRHLASSSDGDMLDSSGQFGSKEIEVSDEEDVIEELRDTKDYQELLLLKRARKLKLLEAETGVVLHHGFSCDGCACSPIRGWRWHCVDCPQSSSVDLCEKCAQHFQTEVHTATHILRPIKALMLRDLCSFRSDAED